MPNEFLKIFTSECGFYFADLLDTPDINSTDVYWSNKIDQISGAIKAPSFRWTNDGAVIQQNLVAFTVPLDRETVIVDAHIVYKTTTTSSPTNVVFSLGERVHIRAKAFDADDWSLGSDGPDDNIEAVDMWTNDTTVSEPETEISQYGSGYLFIASDVTDVVQEVIDRIGWSNGNKILFFLHIDDVTTNFPTKYIDCERNQDTLLYAYLHIEYYYEPLPGGYDVKYWDTIEFVENITSFNWTIAYEDTLEFEEDIVAVREHGRSLTQTLRFFEDVSFFVNELNVSFEDFLFISQDISVGRVREVSLEQTLDFVEIVSRDSQFNKQIEHELTFEEDIDFTRNYSRSLEQILTFMDEFIADKKDKSLIQQLTITQMITFEVTTPLTIIYNDTITFEQDIDTNHNATIEYEDILSITQTILAYNETSGTVEGCGRYDLIWKPFSSGVEFPPKPTLVKGGITLTKDAESVELPAPNFTDREELLMTRIQRKTRGGDLKTFSDSEWPKVRTFRYKFDNLTLVKVTEFHEFLDLTLGVEVELTDHEGREWIGYIVNPQGEAANFARSCGSTTEFDFDGREVL